MSGMLLLVLTTAARAEPPLVLQVAETRAGAYTDTNSAAGHCVAADLSGDAGVLDVVNTPMLDPGVYEARVRLKISRPASPFTARLHFTLKAYAEGSCADERELTVVDFQRPGVFQEFPIIFHVTRRKTIRCSVSWEWHKLATDKRPADISEIKAAAEKGDKVEDGLLLEIGRELDQIKYHLAADQVRLERLGDAEIRDLRFTRARYRPGDEAVVTGCIVNYLTQPRALTLDTEVVRELDAVDTTLTNTVNVPAGGTAPFRVAIPLSTAVWGREARCTLRDGQKVLSRASRYTVVHTNPAAVYLGTDKTMDMTVYRAGPDMDATRQAATGYRGDGYANGIEFVFWGPDDFGDLNPTGTYWSGQMRRANSAESTRRLVDALHEQGMACLVYAKACTPGGKAGYELLRAHPDWVGADYYDMAQLDRWDRSDNLSCWPQLWVNQSLDAPFLHHAREIIRSTKTFGWDMVRYDTGFNNGTNWAHLLRLIRDTVAGECPDLRWGFNSGAPSEYKPGVFELQCEGGGMILEEVGTHAGKDKWTYDQALNRHLIFRDQVAALGGHTVYCPYECLFSNDGIYQDIVTLATRGHRGWGTSPYNAFACRYSGVLWDQASSAVTNAAQWVRWGPGAESLYRWNDLVMLRPLGGGKSQLVMNLVNTPHDRINVYNDNRVPAPLTNLAVTLTPPPGAKAGRVWCLSGDGGEIRQQRLDARAEGAGVAFHVPMLRFWSVVVVEIEGTGDWGLYRLAGRR